MVRPAHHERTWLDSLIIERPWAHQGIAFDSGHVAAKRYLVATDRDYAAQLSDVSVESPRLQGGPMSAEKVQDL